MTKLQRAVLLGLLGVMVALAAACGGPSGTSGAGGGEAARLVPADTAVYVWLNTDFDSDQWQAVDALVKRFPDGAGGVEALLRQLSDEDVDFERDVKPVIGPEVGVAVLDLTGAAAAASGSGSTDVTSEPAVLVTKPRDAAGFEALLAKGRPKPVWQVEDGWYVVATTQEVLERAVAGAKASALADSESFRSALEALPGDSVATAFVNGASVTKAFTEALAGNPLAGSFGKLESIAAGVVAEADGFKIEGVARTQGAPEPAVYKAELPSVAPSGAVAYVSFANLRTGLEQLLDAVGKTQPDFDQQLGQLQLALGLNVENDLLPLFEGEHALYVRPGAPIPEVTLLLSPADPAAGAATMNKLLSAAALFGGESAAVGAPSDVTVGGIQAKKVELGGSFALYYAAVGDHLVLTTAESGLTGLAEGDRLDGDALFQEAKEAVGLPSESLGFVFVDFDRALSLLESFGGETLGGLDPSALENVRAVEYAIAYATGSGGETTFSGFVGIK